MLSGTIKIYRNAYAGLSRSTWLLSFVMLINRSGTMVIPFMGVYLTSAQMGFNESQFGIVSGLFGAGAFSGAYFGGRLTDKIGFYPVQIVTLAGGGILFILLGQMKSYLLICIFTFLVSLVNEAFRPANSTAIAFYSKPEHRTRSYALNRLAINVGWAVGILVGGWITEINFELLFWVDGITNIAAAFLMWFVLKPVDYKPVKQAAELTVPTQSAYKDKTYLWFIAITFLFAACFFQIIQVLPLFFKKELHFSGFYIGVLMAINGIIIAVIEMVMVYKLEGRRRSMSYIVFGVMLTGLSFLTLNLPFMGAQLAIVMILLVTFGEIFSMPFMNSYWIARTQPSNRGQYAGLYTMAWSAAQCLGPLLGAQVAYYWGYTALWWIVGVLALIAAFAFSKLQKAS